MGAGKLEARCFALGGQPLNVEAAKLDSLYALGVTRVARKTPLALNSDSYNDKSISILGFFSVQIDNSIVTHGTVRKSSKHGPTLTFFETGSHLVIDFPRQAWRST